jgi:hypothetical protein
MFNWTFHGPAVAGARTATVSSPFIASTLNVATLRIRTSGPSLSDTV